MDLMIGSNVRIKSYYDLPTEYQTKGMARIAGKRAEIVDKVYSEAKGDYFYRLKVDGYKSVSAVEFTEDTVEYISWGEEPTYRYEFEFLDTVVVATLYETDYKGVEKQIAKGHGHIIHEGQIGIAQAASYAVKRIYEALNGGAMRRYTGD